MTKEEMIEELTEWELHHLSVVEMIGLFVSKYKDMLDTHYTEEEIQQKYDMVFGTEEAIH
jgi:hypothetical protein